MSKYTTELRYYLESSAGFDESKGFNQIDRIISTGYSYLFDFSYPFFGSTTTEKSDEQIYFEKSFCYKFYRREIGFETIGDFKLHLQARLLEKIPFYNRLFESLAKEIENDGVLFNSVDLTETGADTSSEARSRIDTETGTENLNESRTHVDTEQTSDSENTARQVAGGTTKGVTGGYKDSTKTEQYDVRSDTPQGSLSGVENNTYLTEARKNYGDDSDNFTERKYTDYGEVTSDTTNDRSDVTRAGQTERSAIDSNSNEKEIDKTRTGTDTGTAEKNYTKQTTGRNGKPLYEQIAEWRKTFLNINGMLLNEFDDLFMMIW